MPNAKFNVYRGQVEGVFVVAEPDGPTVAAFYAVDDEPGWWRGVVRGRVRRLFVPVAEPLDVAARFLRD